MTTAPTILLLFYLMPSLFGMRGLAFYLPTATHKDGSAATTPDTVPEHEPSGTLTGVSRKILMSERLDSGALLRDILATRPPRDE